MVVDAFCTDGDNLDHYSGYYVKSWARYRRQRHFHYWQICVQDPPDDNGRRHYMATREILRIGKTKALSESGIALERGETPSFKADPGPRSPLAGRAMQGRDDRMRGWAGGSARPRPPSRGRRIRGPSGSSQSGSD